MAWDVALSRRAEKSLNGVPPADRVRLLASLQAMRQNPLLGDVVKLRGSEAFRRRVGSYRIIFSIDFRTLAVHIDDILRRTSTTYR
jgi:mRNA-degrading endonuclease RelE of RelBE toxin-antitoxin system